MQRDREAPETAADVDPDVARLLGLRPSGADDIPDASELDTLGEMTDTRIYEGDLEARPPDSDQPEDRGTNLESLVADELRDGETDDPNEAAEEGMTWVPPVDPPVIPGDDGGPQVAAGFGTTAADEPFDADHHGELISAHDEVEQRVLEALRADASTSELADDLDLDVEGGRVTVAGIVDDLDEEDSILAVTASVDSVTDVVSRIVVRGLDETSGGR